MLFFIPCPLAVIRDRKKISTLFNSFGCVVNVISLVDNLVKFDFYLFWNEKRFFFALRNIYDYFVTDHKRWHLVHVREGRKEITAEPGHLPSFGLRWHQVSLFVTLLSGSLIWWTRPLKPSKHMLCIDVGGSNEGLPRLCSKVGDIYSFLGKVYMVTYASDNEWICR